MALPLSLSTVVAGFVTVLVGFSSSAAVVFQAATALGAGPAEIASWMWAIGIGIGVVGIGLSLRYRIPVVVAWSTPGAAMLVTAAEGRTMPEAIGAFVVSALLITIAGFSGVFARALHRIPVSLASAMLAGVLVRFGLDAFIAMRTEPVLAIGMLVAYLVARRLSPRYAVVTALAAGVLIAGVSGLLHVDGLGLALATPVWTTPAFSVPALVGIAVPLFIVTMASQNVPGIAVLKASGYEPPVSSLVGWTGTVNLVMAPFGGFTLNLAAITAAICMGREAHPDPAKRYHAAVWAGVFYFLIGVSGATVGAVFAAFPKELVMAIAGLALFGTIGNGLATALGDESRREPALITFLVTASGVTLAGIGAAFWGLVAGVLATFVLRYRRPSP
jgi:benzoate membrane transport protein